MERVQGPRRTTPINLDSPAHLCPLEVLTDAKSQGPQAGPGKPTGLPVKPLLALLLDHCPKSLGTSTR